MQFINIPCRTGVHTMKNIQNIFCVVLLAATLILPSALFGRGVPRGPHIPHRAPPVHHTPPRNHGHHHGGYVGPITFAAGVLAGNVLSQPIVPPPPPPPTVITPIVAIPVKVWVPGYYVAEYDVYGRPYSRWIPGHWEYR